MNLVEPDDMIPSAPLPGWRGHFFHSQNMTFGYWEVSSSAADLHEHSHPEEEVWSVVEGEIRLRIEGQAHVVRKGAAAIVPSGATHSATVLGACRMIIVDHPKRDDLPGVPGQTREDRSL